MKCHTAREALSARIDSESEPLPTGATDRHLTSCSDCREWYRRAQVLRRATILHPAPRVPDLTAAIMRQVDQPPRLHRGTRIALAFVAVVQTVMAVAQLFGIESGHDGMAFMGHISHESAAWNVAVGIGLLWAALRTQTAAGQLPLLTAFVGVLAAASLLDLINGEVTVARLVTHIPVLLGVVLLYIVARQHHHDDHPDHRTAAPFPETLGDQPEAEFTGRVPAKPFGFHRPASHHRAA